MLAGPRARSVETEKTLLFDRLGKRLGWRAQTKTVCKNFETAKMYMYAGDPKDLLHLSSDLFTFTGYHEH